MSIRVIPEEDIEYISLDTAFILASAAHFMELKAAKSTEDVAKVMFKAGLNWHKSTVVRRALQFKNKHLVIQQ